MPTLLGVASAAPPGAQAGVGYGSGHVILANCTGKGGGACKPGDPGYPGPSKGGKGGKGGGHHHGWGAGAAIGGAIILGMGYCATQSARCEEEYGDGTGRYWRCMRRAGCAD